MTAAADEKDKPTLAEPIASARGKRLYNQQQAAEMLDRQPKTLEAWRHKGVGPKFVVDDYGRFLGYREEALNDYLSGNEVQSTAEGRARAATSRDLGPETVRPKRARR